MNKSLVVFYHAKCMDGYGAACAVKSNIREADWDIVQYCSIGYGALDDIEGYLKVHHPSVLRFTHALFVDFCPNEKALDVLLQRYEKVCVIDHHATAKDNIKAMGNKEGFLYTIADKFSGASMVIALGQHALNMVFDEELVGHVENDDHGGIFTNNSAWMSLNRHRIDRSELATLLEVRDLSLIHI